MSDGRDELRDRFEDHLAEPSGSTEDTEDTDGSEDTAEADDAGDAGETGHTGHTETAEGSGDGDASDTTRSRSQYAMYLSESLQDELDETFEQFNAQRTLDGEPKVEKHRDFLESVVRAGLEADWEGRIDESE